MLNVKSAHGYYTLAIVIILSLLSLLASRTMTVATQDVVRLSIQEQTDTEAFYAASRSWGKRSLGFSRTRQRIQTAPPRFIPHQPQD